MFEVVYLILSWGWKLSYLFSMSISLVCLIFDIDWTWKRFFIILIPFIGWFIALYNIITKRWD
jgi:hypothetical protein